MEEAAQSRSLLHFHLERRGLSLLIGNGSATGRSGTHVCLVSSAEQSERCRRTRMILSALRFFAESRKDYRDNQLKEQVWDSSNLHGE